MKSKSTIMMIVLAALFVAVAGMFYYQNFHLKNVEKKNLLSVVVAKKDIPKGAPFTTDNVGVMPLSKTSVLDTYILNFDDVKGKTAQTEIYKNEILGEQRVNKDESGEGKYRLSIAQSNELKEIEASDAVRVFVKPQNMSQMFEVLNAKDLEKVNTKTSNSGKDTGQITSVSVLASDKEIELYERASLIGDIIVVPYENLSQMDTANILQYEDAATLIEQTIQYAKDEKKGNSYFGRVHEVANGDTWATIANEYKTSEEFLKTLNVSTNTLKEGSLIRAN